MVTVFHYTPVNAKQFDGLNIDGLTRKHQNSPPPRQNFLLYGIPMRYACGAEWANPNLLEDNILANELLVYIATSEYKRK